MPPRFEVVLVVAAISRLIIYLAWDNLHLRNLRKYSFAQVQDFFENVELNTFHFLQACKDYLKEERRNIFEYLFGSPEFYINMADIDKKLLCGTGLTDKSPHLGRMHIDYACVVVQNIQQLTKYTISSKVSECFGCPPVAVWESDDNTKEAINADNSFQVGTRYTTMLRVDAEKVGEDSVVTTCNTSMHFQQYGVYSLNLATCDIGVMQKPVNANLPIFWAFVVLCILAGARLVINSFYRTSAFRRLLVWVSLRTEAQNDLEAEMGDNRRLLEDTEHRVKRRLRSLDTFRGLAIAIMIFVNYGGGSYSYFNHSPWNGLTVADLVFPWFIWIMGVSVTLSTQSQLRNSQPLYRIMRRILKRSIILFMLGLIINSEGGKNDLKYLRIPGVLQRFSLTYFVVASVEAFLLPKEFPLPGERGRTGWILDLKCSWFQWILTFLFAGIHCLITFLLPVEGCPTGYLGPGGLADDGRYPNCTGGAARVVDIAIFGANHIYQNPTSRQIYQGTQPFDPEGFLGTLNSLVLCWLGAAAGRIILIYPSWQSRVGRFIVMGLLTGLIGGLLCGFSKNEGIIPVNKNLWSLSYILVMASMAFFLLSIMLVLIDVLRFWGGTPLQYAGMNSILLYVGHELTDRMFPWSWKPITGSHAELLAMDLWGAGLWILTSYFLYWHNFFLAL